MFARLSNSENYYVEFQTRPNFRFGKISKQVQSTRVFVIACFCRYAGRMEVHVSLLREMK